SVEHSRWHGQEPPELCARSSARRAGAHGGTMNHEEQLIRYAANQLNESERADFEKHLAGCASCQADLTLWRSLANEVIASDSAVPAPVHLADSALEAIHAPSKLTRAFKGTAQLLRMQL